MKLDNKRTIFVGFAFLTISAFWQVYDSIIPLILKYFFAIGDTLSGAIMALMAKKAKPTKIVLLLSSFIFISPPRPRRRLRP